jgi:hypothetical protein
MQKKVIKPQKDRYNEWLDNQMSTLKDRLTGKVRKLLCGKCNSILGFCQDQKEILLNAVAYLENFSH